MLNMKIEDGKWNGKWELEPVSFDDLSEGAIADDIRILIGDDIKYNFDLETWLYWNGKNWEVDSLKVCREKIIACLAVLKSHAKSYAALHLEDSAKIDKYIKRCNNLNNFKSVCGLLNYLQSKYATVSKDYDQDPTILNTQDGVYDLETLSISKNKRSDMCSKITRAPSSGTDESRLIWRNFLNDITCGDSELASFLQILCGSCIIGRVYEEKVIFARGNKTEERNGSNGKSTFFNAIAHALGDYAGKIDPRVLLNDKDGGQMRAEVSYNSLMGKRLVVGSEMEKDKKLSSVNLKSLVSTDDYLVHKMHSNSFYVHPTHHLLIFTNFVPELISTEWATVRRIIIIPFNAQFKSDDTKTVMNYENYLNEKCGGAIIEWLAEGAYKFIGNGNKLPQFPEAVRKAISEYINGGDLGKLVAYFLNDMKYSPCDNPVSIKANQLRNNFEDWLATNKERIEDIGIGIKQYSKKDFEKAVESNGFTIAFDRSSTKCFNAAIIKAN